MDEELIILGEEEAKADPSATVTDTTKPKAPPPIELVYRQVYDSIDSKLFGFEAQTRINDRKLGTLLPSLFMPLAESSNRCVELGKWSFVEMADMIRRQRNDGRSIGCMFMPVSVKYLCKRYFIDNLARQMRLAEMEPSQVCILIAASVLLEKPQGLDEAIAALREQGVQFGITGVGEEGVSLLQLAELHPDFIRMDAAFTERLLHDEAAKDIGNSFGEMAIRIGTKLIADGVDTKEHTAAWQAVGCSLMQGKFFADYVREDEMFGLN